MESQNEWMFVAITPLPPPAYTHRTVQIKAHEPLLPPSHYYLRWFRPVPPAPSPQKLSLQLRWFPHVSPIHRGGPPKSTVPWPTGLAKKRSPGRLLMVHGEWFNRPDPPSEIEMPLQLRFFFYRNATELAGPPAREVMWPWRLANPVHLLPGWPFQ